jgi:hypothetical protein
MGFERRQVVRVAVETDVGSMAGDEFDAMRRRLHVRVAPLSSTPDDYDCGVAIFASKRAICVNPKAGANFEVKNICLSR